MMLGKKWSCNLFKIEANISPLNKMHEKRNAYHYVQGKEFLHQLQMGLKGEWIRIVGTYHL
jgi:hypothetical protein